MGENTRKFMCLSVVSLVAVAGTASTASAASPAASCNGVLVSSLAGQAGVVAVLTREFHAATQAAGLPHGFFDVAGAYEHAGDVQECLTALDG